MIEESEVPLKVGVSFAIFLLSFLGTSQAPSVAFYRAERPDCSCGVPSDFETSEVPPNTVARLLHRQTLWYRGNPIHSIRAPLTRFIQCPQVEMDGVHYVSTLWSDFIPRTLIVAQLDNSLTSLLSIFLVECAFIIPS